jgi:hypothetical protein
LRHLVPKTPSFYQDRLGTNIGKAALKKRDGAFSDSHFFFCPNGPRLLMEPREMPAPVPIEGSTEIEWPIMCTETSLDAQCFDFTKGLAVVIVGLASLVRNTPLFEPFCTENASFYRDRLGTNIGKALKKGAAFFAGLHIQTSRSDSRSDSDGGGSFRGDGSASSEQGIRRDRHRRSRRRRRRGAATRSRPGCPLTSA